MKIEKKFFWAKFLFMAAWILFAASGAAAQSVLPVGQSGGWQLTFEERIQRNGA